MVKCHVRANQCKRGKISQMFLEKTLQYTYNTFKDFLSELNLELLKERK